MSTSQEQIEALDDRELALAITEAVIQLAQLLAEQERRAVVDSAESVIGEWDW